MNKLVNCFCKYFFLIMVALSFCLLVFNSKEVMATYKEGDVSNGGTITGIVKFAANVPEVRMLAVDKDQEACGHGSIPSEALMISPEGNVKNAVVSITNISKGKKFDRSGGNPAVDQKECVFIPHVIVVPPGSTVDLLNSDDIMHNLHTWSIKNTAFNEGVAGGGKLPKTFEHSETIKITCDVHKWMSAWLVVQSNPYYAITDESGKFKLDGVPAGTYSVQVWQEALGKVTQEVTVSAGGEAKADFELKERSKKRRRRRRRR